MPKKNTPEGLRDDDFINCIRMRTGENVPKIETKALKDAIIRKTRSGNGDMTVGEFVDIVATQYNAFLKRLRETLIGKGKAGFISRAAKNKGYDPNEEEGRKWWIDQVGGDENAKFIEEYIPKFKYDKGDFPEYFKELHGCLETVAPLAMIPEEQLIGMKKKKKKPTKKKKKPTKKKKKPTKKKKGKTSRRRKSYFY